MPFLPKKIRFFVLFFMHIAHYDVWEKKLFESDVSSACIIYNTIRFVYFFSYLRYFSVFFIVTHITTTLIKTRAPSNKIKRRKRIRCNSSTALTNDDANETNKYWILPSFEIRKRKICAEKWKITTKRIFYQMKNYLLLWYCIQGDRNKHFMEHIQYWHFVAFRMKIQIFIRTGNENSKNFFYFLFQQSSFKVPFFSAVKSPFLLFLLFWVELFHIY